jgi:quinol monooxygenase YgiN
MEPIFLLVTYTMQPGMTQAFLSAVEQSNILDKIRQEDGCLRYEYAAAAQAPERVFLLESWASLAQQKIHLTQPHMADLTAIKDQYVTSTTVDYFHSIQD